MGRMDGQPGDTINLTFNWHGEGRPPRQADVLRTANGQRAQVVTVAPVEGCTCGTLDICATVLRADAHIAGPHRVYDLVRT